MRFPGIIPAVTTPFDADGALDLPALERNVSRAARGRRARLRRHRHDGRGRLAERAERAAVVEAVVAAADGRAPVIAGVSSGTPGASVAYARDAAAAGAEAIMLLPPLGYHGDEREIVAFYAAVADGAGLPVMAYNNPQSSGTDMPVELIARLAAEMPGRRRGQGVLGRRAPDRRAARRRPRHRDPGRRRRLGARGPAGRRHGLGLGRGRLRPGRVRRALRSVRGGRPRARAGRLRPAAAARAARHDAQARRSTSRPRRTRSATPAAPSAPRACRSTRRTAWCSRPPSTRSRHPPPSDGRRAAPACTAPPAQHRAAPAQQLRRGRLAHGGDAHPRDHGRRGPAARRDDARAQALVRARARRPAAPAHARATRPRRDVGRHPPAADAPRRRLGRALHRGLRLPAHVRPRHDRRRHRARGDGHGGGERARDAGPARHAGRPGRGARRGARRAGARGHAAQRPELPPRRRPSGRGSRPRPRGLRPGLRRQLLRAAARGRRRARRSTRPRPPR